MRNWTISNRLPFGNREKASSPSELMSANVCGKKKYLVIFKYSYTKIVLATS